MSRPLTRRAFVRGGVAASALTALPTGLSTGEVAAAEGRRRRRPYLPYGRGSYFRSRVLGSPVDRARTETFREFMRTHPEQKWLYPTINGLDGNEWGTAYAVGRSGMPRWRLVGEHHPKVQRLFADGFHAPEWLGDILTGTDDSPLCVMDRESGFTMFCSNAEVAGRHQIRVSSAGITYHSSNGLDYRNRLSNDRRNFTSRGRISNAMVIRRDLVRHGVRHDTDLGHVLHLFLVETDSSAGFRHPMVGEESDNYGFGAEGERLAIDPSVDLTKRGMSPEGLVIARTLQRHGCYIGDNSGSSSALKAQQENAVRPLWGRTLRQDSLKGITWDDFVVLEGSG